MRWQRVWIRVTLTILLAFGTDRLFAKATPIYATIPTTDSFRVMAVGGSTALGWGDLTGKGFLARAFTRLSALEHGKYVFVNKSVEGYGPVQYSSLYDKELATVNPNMVVMSYGILDDLVDKTPVKEFGNQIHTQIQQAMDAHDAVVVVTPTISKLSYVSGSAEQPYIDEEIQVADSFHSPNVYTIDLFDEMKLYLTQHQISYQSLIADGWHLNSKGHALAGQLLAQDLYAGFQQP